MEKQTTIKNKITLKGKGLHTGKNVEVNILPAQANSGIVFKRIDLENPVIVKAEAEAVTETSRGTTIEAKGAKVATIEHLMAALYASNIDNALIEINGEEVPILDGSSKYWLEAIEKSGVEQLEKERKYFCLKEIVSYVDEEKGVKTTAEAIQGAKDIIAEKIEIKNQYDKQQKKRRQQIEEKVNQLKESFDKHLVQSSHFLRFSHFQLPFLNHYLT